MRWTVIAALLAFAAAPAAAQSTARSTSTENQRSTDAKKPVTVTGCLSAGPQKDTFTLTVAGRRQPGPAATGTSGSTGSRAPAPVVPTIAYTLTSKSAVDLKPHIGQEVQVTGIEPPVQATAAARSSTAGSSGQATVSTTAQAKIVARQLEVQSLDVVAQTCRVQR
jgi:hypothetical protein